MYKMKKRNVFYVDEIVHIEMYFVFYILKVRATTSAHLHTYKTATTSDSEYKYRKTLDRYVHILFVFVSRS